MQPAPDHLLTSRLKLRRWQVSDLPPFAKLNASAERTSPPGQTTSSAGICCID